MNKAAEVGVESTTDDQSASHKVLLVSDRSRAGKIDDGPGAGWTEVAAGDLLSAVDADPAVQFIIAPIGDFTALGLLREIDWRLSTGRRLRALLVVEPDQLDLVGGSLGYPWIDYVCGSAESSELAGPLEEARQAFSAPDGSPTLAELGQEAARIAHALSKLAAQLPLATHIAVDTEVETASIRRLIRLRRMRDGFFPPELFADPAWDILLDLTAARLEGIAVSVSSLCIAAAVPTTTGLRWIKAMAERGLLVREPDRTDGRRVLVRLSDATFQRMNACLTALRREGAVV